MYYKIYLVIISYIRNLFIGGGRPGRVKRKRQRSATKGKLYYELCINNFLGY
jgi:hypothetical protein